MLTAAICGDVFASPSVDAVLAGILAVTSPAGCLLVVKNDTGDRLNFGLAAERVRASGLNVAMVVVDDIALPNLPQARHALRALDRGGAGRERLRPRQRQDRRRAVHRRHPHHRHVARYLHRARRPEGGAHPARQGRAGLGIHGEAGVEQVDDIHARGAMAMVADRLSERMEPGHPHLALLNNLGGASVLEMQTLAFQPRQSAIRDLLHHIIGPASMMTSLEMRGFSVSFYPAGTEDLMALKTPVPLSAWPGLSTLGPVQ